MEIKYCPDNQYTETITSLGRGTGVTLENVDGSLRWVVRPTDGTEPYILRPESAKAGKEEFGPLPKDD